MKLPGRIWVWKNATLVTMYTEKWRGPVPEHVKAYVPEAEAERLRKTAMRLFRLIAEHPTGEERYTRKIALEGIEALGGGEEKE